MPRPAIAGGQDGVAPVRESVWCVDRGQAERDVGPSEALSAPDQDQDQGQARERKRVWA